MKIMKSNNIETSSEDSFLYDYLTRLLEQIKIVQGGTNLDATLRRHADIKNYLISKQIQIIKEIELKYFNEDGTLNKLALQSYNTKTLQNK